MSKANEHARIIREQVYHSFPYNALRPDFKGPHADDCGGCIIEAEVDKLVNELESLSHVDDVIADLNRERELRHILSFERHEAFKFAGVEDHGQSVADVVRDIVDERDELRQLLKTVRTDLHSTLFKIKARDHENSE